MKPDLNLEEIQQSLIDEVVGLFQSSLSIRKIAAELLLNVILNRTDLKVKNYDIEIQRADHGAYRKRARFLSSVLDSRMLKTKEDFTILNESYVIFITEKDVLGAGLPMYHINRIIEELADKRTA